jgi:hypothetical protein
LIFLFCFVFFCFFFYRNWIIFDYRMSMWKKRFWDTKRDIFRGVIADAVSNKKNDFVALFSKVILHQFWMKKIFLENSIWNTAVPLFIYVSSRNMFPTTRNLQIRVHVYRPRHYCGDWLTFGCFVPMIVDNDLVKKSFGPMIADHDLGKKR